MKQRLFLVCLFVSSVIVSSKSCISLSSGGCGVGRVSFGGRLILAGNDGAGLGDFSQPFIFVTPFAFNTFRKSRLGYGRGQVWIGKRTCLGYGPRSQIQCPIGESRPCLDNTAPCFSAPPAYTQSEPLGFSDITEDSIRVSWPAWNETTDLGVGPVDQYKLQYREEGGVFNDILLNAFTLQYQFDSLKVGTTYEFRIILIRNLPYVASQPSSVQKATTLHGAPPTFNRSHPLEFYNVTYKSITVTWPAWDEQTDLGVGPVTQYKIQYRETGGTFQDVLLGGSILSHRFDGLKGNTTYEFWIILIRKQPPMEGEPSMTQTKTTLNPAPPSFNRSHPLEFYNVTYKSITVTWPAWDEQTDLGVGPVTQYKIQYRETGGTFQDVLLGESILSHRFDGLKGNTTYEFRIILIREQPPMEGEPSMTQTKTTLNPVSSSEPPAYIQDSPLSFPIVTDGGITVTWPVWDETTGTGAGPITEYRIQYREEGDEFQEIVINDHTVLSRQVDGLKEGTTYEFQIILVSETTTGTPSFIQRKKTLCGDLNDTELVLTTQSKTIGRSRIIAKWSMRNLPDSCEVSQQLITIQQMDNDGCTLPTSGVTKAILLASHRRRITFPDLNANWEFNITLQMTHRSGVYTLSKIQRTEETRPEAPPDNVRTQVKGNDLKGFQWNEPPCHKCHGKIVRYRYSIQKGNEKRSYYLTKDTHVYFQNLAPGTQLTFRVQASTKMGSGPYSVPVTLTY